MLLHVDAIFDVTDCDKIPILKVFVDAPHGVSVEGRMQTWKTARRTTQHDPDDPWLKELLAESDSRTWWDYSKEVTVALGLDDSMNTVKKALEKQRFDVSVDDYKASHH